MDLPEASHTAKPNYDPIPRRKAVKAAIKNYWQIKLRYTNDAGTENYLVSPLDENGNGFRAKCQDEYLTFYYERIDALRVLAARQDARQRYAVGMFPVDPTENTAVHIDLTPKTPWALIFIILACLGFSVLAWIWKH